MPASATFVPSQCGFAFTNAWPSESALVLATPFGHIPVGNRSIPTWTAASPPPWARTAYTPGARPA